MVGCDQNVDDECSAYSGTAVSGTITWTTNQNITKLNCQLKAKIGLIKLPLDCPTPDGCQSLGENQGCPITIGDTVTYSVGLDILPAFPKVCTRMNHRCY